jgi:sigma-B regulation protein RsbU (phosphoserine phosphatase)
MINTTVTRMSGLIDNILDFARGRLGGGITLSRDASRPLEPVLEQVVDELRTASPERSIESSFAILERVNCDRARIGQLVSNLIGNALTHGAAYRPVRVGAKTEGGVFELWVFERRRSGSRTRDGKAFRTVLARRCPRQPTGPGTRSPVASQIAQANGGKITVTSTSEETRFVFRMPTTDR